MGGSTVFKKFFKKIHKLSTETLQNVEAWLLKALKAAPISRKLEIAQNAKLCSKQKKGCLKYEKLPKSCRATCG